MELLAFWLVGSLGFAFGWIVRSALVRRRTEHPTAELHEVDLRTMPPRERSAARHTGGRSTRTKTRTSYRGTINLN